MNKPVNLLQAFQKITEYWDPHIAGELNGQEIKLAKLKGVFPRHCHENEDECFYVFKGQFNMRYDTHIELIEEGSFVIVPAGVYHQPEAENETWVMLFEPKSTLNTGNTVNEFTRKDLKQID